MISLMEYLQLVNVIQYLIYEIENLKKEAETCFYQVPASIVGMNGLEPSISCSQSRRHSR